MNKHLYLCSKNTVAKVTELTIKMTLGLFEANDKNMEWKIKRSEKKEE